MSVNPDRWSSLIETVARLSGRVGLNEVRVRWRLLKWRESLKQGAAGAHRRAEEARYAHWSCPSCGRLNDATAPRCVACSRGRTSRVARALGRFGLRLPDHVAGSVLIGVALIAIHARIMLSSEAPGALGSLSVLDLLRHGANWAPLSLHGEGWRLATSMFLHGGLLHLLFNLIALSQVGPAVETLFGRGLFFVLFLASGVAASLGSALVPPAVPSIGASGAVMGLIGVTAGWGHRHGGGMGRVVRNQMLKWAAYVGVFGLLMPGIDNAAHATGFLAGGALGLFVDPRGQGHWRAVAGGVAAAACFAAALAALVGGFPLPMQ